MSITSIPNKGLVFNMDDYVRLRTSIGGPDFWYPEFQQVLLDKLAPFLPRMEYNSTDNTVTASMVVNGQELMSISRDAGSPPLLPDKELKRLYKCLTELQQEVEAPDVDPDLKRLIQAFRLPDPAKTPEMYRVYGNGKLAIIWGMERVVGSSVSIVDPKAQAKIKDSVKAKKASGKWLMTLFLLAATGLGAWGLYDKYVSSEGADMFVNVPTDDAVDSLVKQAIYKVHILKDGEAIGSATAFAVSSDGILLTNEHVAKDFSKEGVSYQVESVDGNFYDITDMLYHDSENDLALMKANVEGIKYLKLRTQQEPKRTEYIYILGYPLGSPAYFLTTGHITSVDDKNHSAHFYHDAAVSPGSSGSPIVDTTGQVIGVVIGNITDEEKNAQQLNIAVWVGALKDTPLAQPECGHQELPKNSPVKQVPSPDVVAEPTEVNKLPVTAPVASAEQTPETLAKGAADDAKAAEQAAQKAEAASNPEAATAAAKEAKDKADAAAKKADAAEDKAKETGNPDDNDEAKEARRQADAAKEAADKAGDAAADALQQDAEQNPKAAADKAADDAAQAQTAADNADSAKAPENAKSAAQEARGKADDADNRAKGAQKKAAATKKPEDKKAADEALAAAKKADDAADRAEQAAAAADPKQAAADATADADEAEKAVEKVKDALAQGKPEEAQKAADDARKKADEADNKARGAAKKAAESKAPTDAKAAKEAGKQAERAKKAAEQTVILLPRKVTISAPGGLAARVISHQTNADGTEHVVIHVDTPDIEEAVIKGVKLGADHNVEIDIPAGGEHVSYTIRTKGNPIPTSSGIFINVQ